MIHYHHRLVLLSLMIVISFDAAYSQSKVTVKTITDDHTNTVQFQINHGFELKCNFSEPGDIKWEKNGQNVNNIQELVSHFKADMNNTIATYTVNEAKDYDAGTYECVFIDSEKHRVASASFKVAKATDVVAIKVPKNINVVEGEPLKIECLTKGKVTLEWTYENSTYNSTFTQSEDRFKLEPHPKTNVTNGVLRIDEAQKFDRGLFTCVATSIIGGERISGEADVRVKDKYAALWPFLGICVEVFVLCAIIFIYEKKRNKSELEESDTDQSPDQKNTPDHGKDSNLRHRQ